MGGRTEKKMKKRSRGPELGQRDFHDEGKDSPWGERPVIGKRPEKKGTKRKRVWPSPNVACVNGEPN